MCLVTYYLIFNSKWELLSSLSSKNQAGTLLIVYNYFIIAIALFCHKHNNVVCLNYLWPFGLYLGNGIVDVNSFYKVSHYQEEDVGLLFNHRSCGIESDLCETLGGFYKKETSNKKLVTSEVYIGIKQKHSPCFFRPLT